MLERLRGTGQVTAKNNIDVSDIEASIFELEQRIQKLKNTPTEVGQIEPSYQIKRLAHEKELLQKVFDTNLTPYGIVKISRNPLRPLTIDYINLMVDDFVELHGDRHFGDDKAIVCGLGKTGGKEILLIGQQKGKSTKERIAYNFGMPNPEGYRKALHKMKLAERFHLPVITLIDTPGANPDIGAEERGQAHAIAENILEMSRLKTPIISIVIGEGGSGGALGIGVCDRLSILQYAYYSVISPEGCSAILWKDSANAPEAADALKLTAKDLLELGVVDEIMPEPPCGAHTNPQEMAKTLKETIIRQIDEISKIPLDKLLEMRYKKYRKMGVFFE
ncbi:MAG TPA: acetyl-CoA carboxylase carboxyltransferase subunit alpha [Candidatus Brocadiia bacterium]|nr:acetyl-CoA carboxylase carboxyltransferase subunit alpha [Candidatus Brocadiales bacterium]